VRRRERGGAPRGAIDREEPPKLTLTSPLSPRRFGSRAKKGERYYKNVGLGFKTPREAIEGTCDARARRRWRCWGFSRAWDARRVGTLASTDYYVALAE